MATKHTKEINANHYQSLDDIAGTDGAENTDTGILHSDTLCGCGPFKPACLQRLARPVVFTAHAGLALSIFLCGLTYFVGTITTIEKQFQLSSSEVAVLSVVNDAVSLGLVVFVSYFGHTSHRPRWIATGCILVSISFVCTSLPHFLSDPIDTQSFLAGGTGYAQGNGAISAQGTCVDNSRLAPYQTFTNGYSKNLNATDKCAGDAPITGLSSAKWLVIGQVIMGCGSPAIFVLTMSYLNDSVKAHEFTSYTAFLFIAVLLGPIVGFFLTSKATALYVDFDRIPADQIPDIHQYDPRWIGAWWLFFPLFAILLFIAALPLYLYPKVMRSGPVESCGEDEEVGKEAGGDSDEAETASIQMGGGGRIFKDTSGGIIESFKGIFRAFRRLLFNTSLMCLYLGATAETALSVISSTFQVKYYQTQFMASPATAAKLMGGIIVPCICVGQVVSAIICRKFKLNTKQCAGFIVCCHAIALVFAIAQFFIGCESSPVAGINIPYSNEFAAFTDTPNGIGITQTYETPSLEMASSCNSECSCPDEIFQPVCGADGISYISPCHAGCTEMTKNINDSTIEYSNCACVSANLLVYGSSYDSVVNATARPDLCRGSCDANKQLAILMGVSVVAAFVMSLTFNPLMFVIFRLVDPEDRSIALGFQSVVTKCLGYFPAPIIMGMLINSTCTFWQYTCGDRGSCWLYEILDYRYLFVGVIAGLKFISLVCHFAVYFSIKPEKGTEEMEMQEKKPIETTV